MKIEWKSCFKIAVTGFILFLAITYFNPFIAFLGKLFSAATPLIIGCIAAYILNILMTFYEKKLFPKNIKSPNFIRLKRILSIILAIVTLFGIITLILYLVIPELISCIRFILSEIPPTVNKILDSRFVRKYLPSDIIAEFSSINWQENIANIARIVISGIGDAAGFILTTITSVFSGIMTAFISIIITIYLLLDRDRLKKQSLTILETYLPKKVKRKLLYFLKVLNKSFNRFIVGQCTEAVVIGVLCTLGMLLFTIPYAGMVGALIGFTALIPIAGAYVGAVVGAVMIMTVSIPKALFFLVFIIALQQIEGNLIYPKIVGKSIGLPALWVLVAVSVGGGIAGIPGMLIGVPLFATIYRIVKADVYKRNTIRKISEPKESDVTE